MGVRTSDDLQNFAQTFSPDLVEHRRAEFVLVAEVRIHRAVGAPGRVGAPRKVWSTGCNSWYLTDEGNVDLWPYDRKTMTGMRTKPDDRDYHVVTTT